MSGISDIGGAAGSLASNWDKIKGKKKLTNPGTTDLSNSNLSLGSENSILNTSTVNSFDPNDPFGVNRINNLKITR